MYIYICVYIYIYICKFARLLTKCPTCEVRWALRGALACGSAMAFCVRMCACTYVWLVYYECMCAYVCMYVYICSVCMYGTVYTMNLCTHTYRHMYTYTAPF